MWRLHHILKAIYNYKQLGEKEVKKEKWISLIMTSVGLATGMILGGLIFGIDKPVLEIVLSAVIAAVLTFIIRYFIDRVGKKKN